MVVTVVQNHIQPTDTLLREHNVSKEAMKATIERGDMQAVEAMIERGTDVNMIEMDTATGSQHSILILAMTTNKYEIAKLLLRKGAEVDTVFMNYDVKNECLYGITAIDTARILYEVSLNSQIGEILHDIEESLKNYKGREPTIVPPTCLPDNVPAKVIIDAVNEGDLFSVDLLLNHGQDVNTIEMDETGNKVSILISAISQCYMDVAKLLIQRGAIVGTIFQNVNEDTGKTYEVTALSMANRRYRESSIPEAKETIELIESRLRKAGKKAPETIVSSHSKNTSTQLNRHTQPSKITAWLQKPVPLTEVVEASNRDSGDVDSFYELDEVNGNAKKYSAADNDSLSDTTECVTETTVVDSGASWVTDASPRGSDMNSNTVKNSKTCAIL